MTIGLANARLGVIDKTRKHLDISVAEIQKSQSVHYLPQTLITRATFHHQQNKNDQAWTDLNEALEIAERGKMGLWPMDGNLLKTRMLLDKGEQKAATELFIVIEKMIRAKKYGLKYKECKGLRERIGLENPWVV